jgi:hypothetical protein
LSIVHLVPLPLQLDVTNPTCPYRWLARGLSRVAPAAARGITKYYRKKLTKAAFSKVLAAAPLPKRNKGPSTPPLTTTAVQLMDFTGPSSAASWGYFFIMLQHVATLLNAYLPELLFVGQVSVLSELFLTSHRWPTLEVTCDV